MNENRFSNYVIIIMKNLNLWIVLYIAAIMSYCLRGYIRENSATEFLSGIGSLPMSAWKIPILVVCLYGACLLLMSINNMNGFMLYFKICIEVGISFLLSYILGFSYTGIILLVLADTLKYFPTLKRQFSFAIILSFIYLLIDFDLISIQYNIIPLETYLGYFQSDARSILLGIKNMVSSFNTFIFLVYAILLVRIQMSEKERILSLNEQLNEANSELQRVNIRLGEYVKESEKIAQTRERNRLAREIHDTLGHALTGIITGIEACIALMDVAPDATKIQLKAISEVARQGITDVRRSVKALRPDALEKDDLGGALMRTISEMRTATNAQIDYRCDTNLDGFSEDEEDIIYRIVQESITNSIRHGKADHIWIHISKEYNLLKIDIRDNGLGCANVTKGFGLHHMEERLNMLNGSLDFDGTDGFMIEARIPIRWGKGGSENDKNFDR